MSHTYRRRIIREKVLQLLYAFEMNAANIEPLIKETLADVEDPADKEFANNLINQIILNKKKLDELIKARVDNWDLSRIALIDRILLRIGICEILFFPDIPPKVSINEAIEIAKDYSTSSSGKFINGILDAILADLKKDNKLNKKGRGLLEESLPKSSSKK
ncbi:MAG: transcription antitermination factor NusB [Ignavibacteria bacterium RIFOXYB2_FULL_35_12]|nr:MAG: transcription antitermination factor NusB [Ignavibacteria bacterium GWA2_36_19]OGU48934.1 MAG: transcription antitermination factor NusB [Ignavibacteria bacterium GWC2_35_8]OGU58188.1 MAG: transcription antitermination factor NusB [Ignavibacteria bacterium GWF2_35_20]OGU77817.1 MAG: transcription antitermination factor NusB [Ignavibacteria bacterium RBG_16_35_7]OGU82550.1 MAG: transcription antitermination factor NusB [Ignavibacteria bacterium RIFOXYA2_FULL_35_9]OGU87618.1 MAG: transcr